MERKTRVDAADGKQDLLITREFDLPLELLFKAYAEAEIVEQWMGTRVVKLENKKHGGYQFETTDAAGQIVFQASGVIHDFSLNRKITRTFEMENTAFPVQLEFLEFEKLGGAASLLNMQIVYKSVADRDQMLKLPFASGLNAAHDRLQTIAGKLKRVK